MAIKYKVELTQSQRLWLRYRRGKPCPYLKRALALLKADEGLSTGKPQWRFQ